mmetsp:Transcript_22979/g.32377  ORF Transcript_22979/g.32377 Transcript_22979/m.32377 type:complete len:551 (+) Transcript_22979:113-1765(+)|eukprot:CAMPEP_0184865222 /NCGR_PEP_ID=MMETSP0580-20130426/17360_1 /TAXON_ID=1118495 /ORGANISM="Dactyliosolen fragilissimus" /LENGTH=550 /DNA_ID=CAMNT_0027364321 /DNA_START=1 /DNA_END=1653 /DNA_ORIENTATION=-
MKRRRDKLSPKPILDKRLLRKALDERGVVLRDLQLATFYQLLHRQQYPSLEEFVNEYYRNDPSTRQSTKQYIKNIQSSDVSSDPTNAPSQREQEEVIINARKTPTKNPISLRNKNIRQLPKPFLDFLADPDNDFATLTSSVNQSPTSKDGTTTKMAVRLQDGHLVESVLMRHVSNHGSRATLCVSSQVGCAMGCTFCATGTMGIRGDLTSGEILEQLVHAGRILALEQEQHDSQSSNDSANDDNKLNSATNKLDFVRNIVFMGMGEPLNNYENVLESCKAMIDRRRWNLAHGRVTVSTVGVTPRMKQLTQDLPEVNLALSLHAPNQIMREKIVPTARMYPIQDMIDALDDHMMALTKGRGEDERVKASKRKRAMIEYVMLKGETSNFECAHQLGKLCENKHLVVNLIPYNQTDVKDKLSCPSNEHMNEFQRIVSSYGSFCFIRRTMGADIAGACGQLVVEEGKKEKKSLSVVDIEDSVQNKSKSSEKNGNKTKSSNPKQKNYSHERKETNRESKKKGFELEHLVTPLVISTALATSYFVYTTLKYYSRRR